MSDETTPLSMQDARTMMLRGVEDEVATLRRFNPRRRIGELAFFVLLWPAGAAITCVGLVSFDPGRTQTILAVLGILVSAVALNAWVLLLHEGMHHTLFASPFWNRWVSVFLGVPVLMSFSAYQVLHLRHHHYLGDPRDPDDYANYSKRPRLVWLMHYIRLACGAFLYLLCIPILTLRHGTSLQRRHMIEEYVLIGLIATVATLTIPGRVILWGWFVPVILVGYMTNIRGFAQHGISDASDPFLASRTMTPPAIVRFFLLHENYHLEHHFFPEVPDYHLHRLHLLVRPRLPRAVTGRSYVAFLAHFLRATLTLDRTPIGRVTLTEQERLA
jgi:fatty acid desaturase